MSRQRGVHRIGWAIGSGACLLYAWCGTAAPKENVARAPLAERARGSTAKAGERARPPLGNRMVAPVPTFPEIKRSASDRQAATVPAHPELVVQIGHRSEVLSARFSPDGTMLASGSEDGVVKLWHVATGALLRTLSLNVSSELIVSSEGQLAPLAFSPDGKVLAVGYRPGAVTLWDVGTGRVLRQLVTSDEAGANVLSQVFALAFSPDGRLLASAGNSSLNSSEGPIRDVASVKLWEVTTGKKVGSLKAEWCVAFSRDGNLLATGGKGGSVKLWDVARRRLVRSLTHDDGFINAVAFGPDGTSLASGSDRGTIAVWNFRTGQKLRTITRESSNPYRFEVNSVAFSADGKMLAGDGVDGDTSVWDLATGEKRHFFIGGKRTVAFHPDRPLLATAGRMWSNAGFGVFLWSVASGQPVRPNQSPRTLEGQTLPLMSMAASPDGRALAAAYEDPAGHWPAERARDTVRIWHLAASGQPSSIPCDAIAYSVAFSPDARLLAIGHRGGIRVHEANTYQRRPLFEESAELRYRGAWSVAFSPDSRTLAAGLLGTNSLFLGDVTNGRTLFTLQGEEGAFGPDALAFSPDGKLLASGSSRSSVMSATLWDVTAGTKSGELLDAASRGGYVGAIAFSSGGRTLAVGGSYRIMLWDISSRRLSRTLRDRSMHATAVAFSPNGRFLASGYDTGQVNLWDLPSGQPVCRLEGHAGRVSAVAFSPDGQTLFSSSSDGTIRAWRVDGSASRELGALFVFRDGTWTVVGPEGRYNASNGGDIVGLHGVVGNEPIELKQLKERCYDPGLLAKLLGFNKEPLREVSTLTRVDPPPAAALQPPAPGTPKRAGDANNHGGGVGHRPGFVNGRAGA